jgi:hypothetical protein
MLRHYIAIFKEPSYCLLRDAQLGSSRWNIVDGRGDLRSPCTTSLKNNTPIHNILSTAPQLSISQKALGTLPEDDNVMPKHVGDTLYN